MKPRRLNYSVGAHERTWLILSCVHRLRVVQLGWNGADIKVFLDRIYGYAWE